MSDLSVDERYERVLGFDLGHGETAVTRMAADVDAHVIPDVIEVIPGQRTLITAVGTRQDGKRVLGEIAAITPHMTSVDAYFKKRPDRLRPEDRTAVEAFVRGVVAQIVDRSCPVDEETLVVFGHPSGWGKEHVAEYRSMLAPLVAPAGMHLIPESRAAFIASLAVGEVSSRDLNATFVIVDCGSSTTDFTAIEAATSSPLDVGDFDGVPLGAGLIDAVLLEQAITRHSDPDAVRAVFAAPSTGSLHRNRAKIECRKVKEQFYSSEEFYREDFAPPLPLRSLALGPVHFGGEFTADSFDSATSDPLPELGGLSWRDRLRHDMTAALEGLGRTPDIVILTGGAARMSFVKDVAVEVYGGVARQISRAGEPGLAISRGLALAGHMSGRVSSFRREIAAFTHSESVEELVGKHLPGLADALASVLAPKLREDLVLEEMYRWKAGEYATLAEVTDRVVAAATLWQGTEEFSRRTAHALEAWYEGLAADVRRRTDPICERYGLPKGSLSVRVDVSPTAVSAGDPGAALLEAPKAIASAVMLAVGMVMGTVAFGAGTAALSPTGPLAPIIAGGLVWLVGAVGIDIAGDKLQKVTVPQWMRTATPKWLIRKSLSSKPDEFDAKVRDGLHEALVTPKTDEGIEQRAAVVQQIARSLDSSLDEQADLAELLIK